jgi:ribosome-associated protein
MSKKNEKKSPIIEAIIAGMQEKKAKDIVHIDLQKLQVSVADHFVICHADNDKQVEAIASSVEEEVRKYIGEKPYSVEGKREGEWVLLDYINAVVHVFLADKRELYGIEDLWGDGDIRKIEESYTPAITR